jgi:hypothetical protein
MGLIGVARAGSFFAEHPDDDRLRIMALPSSRSQPQEALGVAERYPLPVGGAHRQPIKEGARLCHRRVGVVGREHDPLGAYLKQ